MSSISLNLPFDSLKKKLLLSIHFGPIGKESTIMHLKTFALYWFQIHKRIYKSSPGPKWITYKVTSSIGTVWDSRRRALTDNWTSCSPVSSSAVPSLVRGTWSCVVTCTRLLSLSRQTKIKNCVLALSQDIFSLRGGMQKLSFRGSCSQEISRNVSQGKLKVNTCILGVMPVTTYTCILKILKTHLFNLLALVSLSVCTFPLHYP